MLIGVVDRMCGKGVMLGCDVRVLIGCVDRAC